MVKLLAATGCCAVVFIGAGCATVINGRSQAVTVISEPSGARVFVKDQQVGITPARLELPRRDAHIVLRLEKDGFSAQEVAVKQSLSGWLALDVGVGLDPLPCQGLSSTGACPAVVAGNVGALLAIDFLTGAAHALPRIVRVVLAPKE
jgi:hypothetical protein